MVSWPLQDGVEKANCLQCFFDIIDIMGTLHAKYTNKWIALTIIESFQDSVCCQFENKVTSDMKTVFMAW